VEYVLDLACTNVEVAQEYPKALELEASNDLNIPTRALISKY